MEVTKLYACREDEEIDKDPQPHVGYVGMSRAKTNERDSDTGFANISLTHPLRPGDFELPEIRRQTILREYDRLRRLEESPLLSTHTNPQPRDIGDGVYNTRANQRHKTSSPIISFSEDEDNYIRRTLRSSQRDEEEIVNNYGIAFTRGELRGLIKKHWITDDTINYIFSIWNDLSMINGSRHVFVSTFFMDRLHNDGDYSFSNVYKWFNEGEDIKNDSVLYIPVNIKNMHWTLIVIDMQAKTLKYYDGLRGIL